MGRKLNIGRENHLLFVDEVLEKALEDPDVIKELVDDIVDELSDELEDDPEFKARIIEVASKDRQFRAKTVEKLIRKIKG